MSLTSHLNDKSSPVRQFFERRLPVTDMVVWATKHPGSPGEPKILPVDASDYPWSPVGMAFDYRLRYFFRVTPVEELVAAHGARVLGLYPVLELLGRAIDELTTAHDPRGRVLQAAGELALCRYCYLLALFEKGYRAGYSVALAEVGAHTGLEELLPLCEDRVAEDLAALAALFAETQAELYGSAQFVLNPTFAASALLGGADADLIVQGRLVEVKTLKSGRPYPVDNWQLAGYALADWDDQYGIDEVGFYLSRHGVQHVWTLEEYLEALAGNAASIPRLRAEFREVCSRLPSSRTS